MKQSIFYIPILVITVLSTIISCSKISTEMDPIVKSVYSGGVYIYTNTGPYTFSIDSLIQNCSTENSLVEILEIDDVDNKDFETCTYDSSFTRLANQNEWDFKVNRGYSTFDLKWKNSPIAQKSMEVKTLSESGKYPFLHFYNGYKIKPSEDITLTLLFFNNYIGGAIHDYIVWEYVETE